MHSLNGPYTTQKDNLLSGLLWSGLFLVMWQSPDTRVSSCLCVSMQFNFVRAVHAPVYVLPCVNTWIMRSHWLRFLMFFCEHMALFCFYVPCAPMSIVKPCPFVNPLLVHLLHLSSLITLLVCFTIFSPSDFCLVTHKHMLCNHSNKRVYIII